MNRTLELKALHRYLVWANCMRVHFEETIENQSELDPAEPAQPWLIRPFAYASYWFATLFTITEGIRELNFSNAEIDRLLSDTDKVDTLRRFRNCVFHFQRDYFDKRTIDFMKEENLDWARSLHDAISRQFLDYFGIELI